MINKTKNTLLITTITLTAILIVGSSIQLASAYEVDTHYHWTFFLALYVGFDWDEAHLIASGDYRQDETGLVAGGPVDPINHPLTANPNNFEWHALSLDDTAKQQRLTVLKQRALAEQNIDMKLVKFGQYLHYQQDMEPHDGYNSLKGHLLDFHAPDSPGWDKGKFERTTLSTLTSLNMLLLDLDRPQKALNIPEDIQPLINEIYDQSSYWRPFENSGQEKNRATIEQAIPNLPTSIPLDTEWTIDRPLIPDIIQGQFDTTNSNNRGDPIVPTWQVHHGYGRIG